MNWKYLGHVQGTNCSEFQCDNCQMVLIMPELPDLELPNTCERCGAAVAPAPSEGAEAGKPPRPASLDPEAD